MKKFADFKETGIIFTAPVYDKWSRSIIGSQSVTITSQEMKAMEAAGHDLEQYCNERISKELNFEK